MIPYLEIVVDILSHGTFKENRTGVGAYTLPGMMFKHNMERGFPLLTTKFVPIKLVASELEGFIKGITDKKWFQEKGNHIWDEFSYVDGRVLERSKTEREIYQLKSNDLGMLYGFQWGKFNADDRIPPPNANIPYKPIINDKAPVYQSTNYGEFYLVDDLGDKIKIQFKETGYTSIFAKSQVNTRKVKDPYYKKYFGEACIGLPDKSLSYHKKAKQIWTNLISRCYNEKAHDYHLYGGNGVRVCNDWLVFEYFLEDLPKIPHWDEKLKSWDMYSLDKDKIGNGFFYSLKTCLWATTKEQSKNKKTNIYFDAISPKGEIIRNQTNLTSFCLNKKIDPGDANKLLNNKRIRPVGGWKFINKRTNRRETNEGIDQLFNIIHTLKTNPNDRRMIVSAWNPRQLHQMALPPCHYSFQVTVDNGFLNLAWNQRSVDVALGLPFNIASYALLLLLFCAETGYKPGHLIGFLMDTHIYENHVDGMKEQLIRQPKLLPKVHIVKEVGPGGFSMLNWDSDDILLMDYEYHPKINFEIAV